LSYFVIASAAKQSILSLRQDGLLRFARNDGAGNGLLRFARNDGRGNGLLRGASDEAIQAFDIGPRDISD
jgi:hypothetical protein